MGYNHDMIMGYNHDMIMGGYIAPLHPPTHCPMGSIRAAAAAKCGTTYIKKRNQGKGE